MQASVRAAVASEQVEPYPHCPSQGKLDRFVEKHAIRPCLSSSDA